MADVTFHIIGDAYVDFFSFLEGDWPERGGDSILNHPVTTFAGGSSNNTATHLTSLGRNFVKTDRKLEVVLHTVLNPNDHYGQLLLEHVAKHGFPLVNCRDGNDTSSTGHCIAIVSGGERSFMTHPGCVGKFSASDLQLDRIINTDGPLHLHIAGYFNVSGFWNGSLEKAIVTVLTERKTKYPNRTTTVSLVTQHDASKAWDGGIGRVIPYLDFLIMNELECSSILRKGSRGTNRCNESSEWIAYFSELSPSTVFIVTKGALGACAFRNHQVLASVEPAHSVKVIDPTGAGDSFTAGFLHQIWAWKRSHDQLNKEGWTSEAIQEGLQWGCAVGTAAVTIRGASVPCEPDLIVDIYNKQKEEASKRKNGIK